MYTSSRNLRQRARPLPTRPVGRSRGLRLIIALALGARVGQRLVAKSVASQTDSPFEFHLLADPDTINAFALPGGQVFITDGLLTRLQSEGQLAGVLAHEIVHVLARHGAQRIAKQELTQGLTAAVGV